MDQLDMLTRLEKEVAQLPDEASPIAKLAEAALAEHRAGKTRSL